MEDIKSKDYYLNYDSKCHGIIRRGAIKRCNNRRFQKSDFCRNHQKNPVYDRRILKDIKENQMKKFKLNSKDINQLLAKVKKEIAISKLKSIIKERIDQKINNLDNEYQHFLLGLHDSWRDIPIVYQTKLGNEVYDLTFLSKMITEQLNSSNMENPYPIYPNSPFTRRLFTIDELMFLKYKFKILKIPINIALKELLNLDPLNIKLVYTQALNNPNRYSDLLNDLLKKRLRFKLINYKNSQECYIGFWVPKNYKLSSFEEIYNVWLDVPYQILCPHTFEIIDNPYKDWVSRVLKRMRDENWDLIDKVSNNFL